MRNIILFISIFSSLLAQAQNVGVGTSAPSARLHVVSVSPEAFRLQATNPYLSFYNGTTYKGYLWYNSNRMELGTSSAEPIVLSANYTDVAYFTPGGRMGVGVSPTIGKLDVLHNSLIASPQLALVESGTDFARLTFKNTANPSYWTIAGFNDAINADERLNFYNSTSGDLMSISGNGNVGIGTTLPTSRLHVTSPSVNSAYLHGTNTSNTSAVLNIENTNTSMDFYATGLRVNAHAVDGRGRGLLVQSGSVGGEFYSTDMVGGSQNYGISASARSDNDCWGLFGVAQMGAFNGGVKIGVYGNASGGLTNWAFYGAGSAFLSGGTWQTSDERLKKDIRSISQAAVQLKQLKAKTYLFDHQKAEFLNLPSEQQFGFLASEIEKVFPNLVKESQHYTGTPFPGSQVKKTSLKSVNYQGLIPVITEAVNEHTDEINGLKKQNVELQKLVLQLSQRLLVLEEKLKN